MTTILWGGALIVGLLWPSRLIGRLDGAPLDQPLEVIVIAVLLPAIWYVHPAFLRTRVARAAIGALAIWKIATWALLAQTGWCGLFASKYEPPNSAYRVDRSWDARTFWSGAPPACTAIVARPYHSWREYPAWILNIPFQPDFNLVRQEYFLPAENPRPPHGVHALFVGGWVYPRRAGTLAFDVGRDVSLSGSIDRMPIAPHSAATVSLPLAAGAHAVDLRLDLERLDWRFVPTWNGRPLFTEVTTSVAPLAVPPAIVPWAAWVAPALVGLLFVGWSAAAVRAVNALPVTAWAAISAAALFAIGVLVDRREVRLVMLPLVAAAALPVPERLRTLRGAFLLFGVPWLAFYSGRAMQDVGSFVLYSFGDDWLTFQRHAYRIFMQGYWLEGGERLFWNQPLYRWTNGVLHLAFGDSSVGEVLADAAGLLIGALFAFEVVRRLSTFRAGLLAGVLTLVTIALGPNWYFVGRGLSEVSASAWLYLACFALIRVQEVGWGAALLAGLFAALSFFTRLNHLPLVVAMAALTLPLSFPAGRLAHVAEVVKALPKSSVAVYLTCIAGAVTAFALRTWYYTGTFSLFAGTTREHNATGLTLTWRSLASADAWRQGLESVLMIVTVQDPPRFDVRAVLVIAGVAVACAGLLNAPVARRLPLGLAVCCLGAIAGGLVARGVAYPGRFSVHLIPIAVALSMGAVALAPSGR